MLINFMLIIYMAVTVYYHGFRFKIIITIVFVFLVFKCKLSGLTDI